MGDRQIDTRTLGDIVAAGNATAAECAEFVARLREAEAAAYDRAIQAVVAAVAPHSLHFSLLAEDAIRAAKGNHPVSQAQRGARADSGVGGNQSATIRSRADE